MKKLLFLIAVVGLGAAGYYFGFMRDRGTTRVPRFRTGTVTKGEVLEGVAANGAVQPHVLVQVGTQVSGTIEKLFKDFNDTVKEGETIAILDSRRLVAQVAQDQAALTRSKADADNVRARLNQAVRELERQKNLLAREVGTSADYDVAVANLESYKAQLGVAFAAIEQSRAQLDGDLVNLRYATITSPVEGVVVSRSVDVGQTVAASLSTPTLFVIAKDLTKIQVQVSVPEAEIGRIRDDMPARFYVDAHQGVFFEGRVSQVRLASTTVSNVVTYTVLVDADNPKGLLLPGMTANVVFEVARSPEDALRVPSPALRFKPTEDLDGWIDSPEGDKPAGDRPKGERGARAKGAGADRKFGKLYVKTATGRLTPVPVKLGPTDGAYTVVTPIRGTLEEGAEVVVAVLKDEEAKTTNPFGPPAMGGGRRGGGH